MKPWAQSALWASVITTTSSVVLWAQVSFAILSRAPWLGVLSWPSFPGFLLAMILSVGPNTEGIPKPTNLAIPVLTFVVWWGIVHFALARWRRRRARSQWLKSPLP